MMCLLKQSEHGEIFSIEEQMNKNASYEIDLINVLIIIIITIIILDFSRQCHLYDISDPI